MNLSFGWLYVFAIIGGLIAAWRIWQNLQKLRQRQNDSWDARLIDQLRKRGSDPFKPHDVDFWPFRIPRRPNNSRVSCAVKISMRKSGTRPTTATCATSCTCTSP